MDPAVRSLMRVNIEDAAEAERMVTILMGDKAEPRKAYISAHANFNKEDHFSERSAAAGRRADQWQKQRPRAAKRPAPPKPPPARSSPCLLKRSCTIP